MEGVRTGEGRGWTSRWILENWEESSARKQWGNAFSCAGLSNPTISWNASHQKNDFSNESLKMSRVQKSLKINWFPTKTHHFPLVASTHTRCFNDDQTAGLLSLMTVQTGFFCSIQQDLAGTAIVKSKFKPTADSKDGNLKVRPSKAFKER